MKKFFGIASLLASATLVFNSCGGSDIDGYDKSETGFYYKFYNDHKDDGVHPKTEEEMSVKYVLKVKSSDSILFDSRTSRAKDGIIPIILRPNTFKGSFEDALASMCIGDSASFLVNADSFYLKTIGMPQLPPFLKPNDKLMMDIKLISIRDAKTVETERKKKQEEGMAQMKEMDMKSRADLEKYIADNKIKASPTQSGLYYIEVKKGKGAKVNVGDVVQCFYKGTLLDGSVFDESDSKNPPIEFPVGVQQLIAGWDEGIPMMNVGGKAKLIVPYQLAYGPRGRPGIPPFANLVFDIEVVGTKKDAGAMQPPSIK